MGLLNKLKNVLFEEEEIEIPESEEKVEVQKEKKEIQKKREPVKMTFNGEDDDILSDRELFKAEPTFNFPSFDEKEFDTVKQEEPRPSISPEVPTREVKPRARSIVDYEPIEPKRVRTAPKEVSRPKYTQPAKSSKKMYESPRNDTRKFTPSPVISPVYGVLDKNYKKEDVVVRGEEKKTIDVDSVRKKAFGTLEEDIEKTLSTPVRTFYQEEEYVEPNHGLEELLASSSEEIIPVFEKEETISHDSSFNIEEELVESSQEELEVLDHHPKRTIEEKLEDETLENDLFDLIDSMYENREDGE